MPFVLHQSSPDLHGMLSRWFKHHEFWSPRVFELPFYCYLLGLCMLRGLPLRQLAKANYALDHGEIGLGSKFETQQVFDEKRFPVTEYLDTNISDDERIARALRFGERHGFPVIVKPDIGMVGKGVVKLHSAAAVRERMGRLHGNYLLQSFCDLPLEFGVFYVSANGKSGVTGINHKHYPAVTGDGQLSLAELAQRHPRYNEHWQSFMQYHDESRVPEIGEQVVLSFIGSHTLGCCFTDCSDKLTEILNHAVCELFDPVEGFNYGRMDVKAESLEALQRGEFVVIEVNGISSLPTHMFDPGYSLIQSYQHFFEHARYLVQAATEHQHKAMNLMSLLDIARRVRLGKKQLEDMHRAEQRSCSSLRC